MNRDLGKKWKPLPRFTKTDFNKFRDFIREHCGLRIPDNKQQLLKNRIGKRLRELGFDTYVSYYDYVTSKEGFKNEVENLWSVVTTHQTYFFREPHHFDALRGDIFPRLATNRNRSDNFRIWSAGCSSGEEAYTLAALLKEHSPKELKAPQVVASDIDKEVIATATAGQYPADAQKTIPVHYRTKYFDVSEKLLTPKPGLKQLITFKQHNLRTLTGIPGKFDVIFCRNVIMYFEQDFRLKLMKYFGQMLRDDGYLFLGSSESFHGLPRFFEYEKMGKTLVYRKAVKPASLGGLV